MLLGQITDAELGFYPGIRHKAEFITITLIIFANRGELKKIACCNHLNTTKCGVRFFEVFQYLINEIELLRMQHGDLVNNQHLRIFKMLLEVFALFHAL